MSITPAQLIAQAASTENSADPRTPSPPASPLPARTSGSARSSPSASQPASAPANPVNTDLRVDDQHQFYYQFVDASTGDVVFEIPPEALRAIGESLNLTPESHTAVHNVDVKS